MALEDRCSPQTAPSPPHQGQNQITSATMISPTHEEMSLVVPISPIHIKQEINEQPQNISFSISNILSDTFGRTHPNHISTKPNGPASDKKESLFRPYDISKSPSYENQTPNHPLLMYNSNRINEIYDLSRKSFNGLVDPRTASLLNGFSASAYPKLHEEIINSHRKFQTKLLESQIKAQQQQQHHIPPLGSLCKTVSQIGQIQSANISSNSNVNGCNSRSSSVSPKISTPKPSLMTPQPKSSLDNTLSSNDGMESSDDAKSETSSTKDGDGNLWPAWVYCTRYSDRPSSGPRYRRTKIPKEKGESDEKRPRTAFSNSQLARLKNEFNENRYLTEKRRQQLSAELGLNEAQIKIWFQNKRAKIKKTAGEKNPLALQLMAQGLYNHSTVPLTKEEEELEMRMNGQIP